MSSPVLPPPVADSGANAAEQLEQLRKEAERTKLIANERAKLTATFVNTVAGALIVTGLFTPIFGEKLFEKLGQPSFWIQSLAGLLCLVIAILLHIGARAYLGTLR